MRAPFFIQAPSKLNLTGVSFNADLEPTAGSPMQSYQKSNELATPGFYLEPYIREVAWADMSNIPVPNSLSSFYPAYWSTAYLMSSINSSGYIISASYVGNRVEIIDTNNFSHINTFGSAGNSPGQFNSSYGSCSDGEYVYISEHGTHRIQKFRLSDLSYVTGTPTGSSTADGRFTSPGGLDTDGTYLYVADAGNNRVQKLNCSDLSFVAKTGGTVAGAGNDQFNWPIDIEIHGSYIFVADYNNHRFVKRGTGLEYVTKTGTNSQTTNGNFYYPRQISSIGDYLYLTDGTARCQKTTLSLSYVDKCVIPGTQNWGSTAVDNFLYLGSDDGRIYKYSADLNRITEYDGNGYLEYFAPVPETVGFGWDTPSFEPPEPLPMVIFSPPSYGAVVTTSVSLSTIPSGGITIRYSTDGSDITLESSAYSTPISVSVNPTTIRARATSGVLLGPLCLATYTNYTGVNAPIFNPVSGEYSGPINLSMTTTTTDSNIYYTTDGSSPDAGDTLYTGVINVGSSSLFKAVAVKGALSSSITTGSYSIVPNSFDYVNNTIDKTGPWSRCYPDGVNDYHFQTTFNVPSGGWDIKRFEIYQITIDETKIIGQFWSTDNIIYPISLDNYYRDEKLSRAAYNLMIYSGSTPLNSTQKSYLFNLNEGAYVLDLFGTKSVDYGGRFILCVVGEDGTDVGYDITRMFSTNHP